MEMLVGVDKILLVKIVLHIWFLITKYSTSQNLPVFARSLLCSSSLHLQGKKRNIVKYSLNLKYLFSVLMFFVQSCMQN